jgi:LuxR family transcriptional regulator, maltose regulon positive regulatory protein
VPDPLLATKVSLPLLRQPIVPRRELLKRLRTGLADHHLLTLISAPAGYGKTTTVRLWLEELNRPVAWVRLEKTDNELSQFLKYVLAAFQQSVENLGRTALEVVESAPEVDPSHVLSLLINDLYALEQPLILVLEDYQLIENPAIDTLLDSLLHQAIPNLHLVIMTREDPGLPLAHLRVKNQLTEIRAADLRFSLEEATEFFAKVMSTYLPEKQVGILAQRTEGWVAGLQLAALSLKESQDPAAFIRAFRGTHRHVLDYLLEEVLHGQAEEVRNFLRQTSILEQLSASLCEAVTGQQNSHQLLRYLERNNLFLVPLDDHRTWYRYHALFAELLKNQLLQTEPERWDGLQARAAGWYQANGYIHEAIEHAFQVSDRTLVLQLLEAHVFPLLFQGEVTTVAAWFERLPDFSLQTSPMLCIAKAWSLALMQRQTRTEEVEQALQAAGNALKLADADEALRNRVAGHTASIQAYLMQTPAFARENPEKLIEISQRAQQLLPAAEKALRSVNALNIGRGYTVLADLPAAERAYNQALEDGVAGGNFYAAIYGPINLVVIDTIKGELNNALQMCEINIDRFNRLLAGQRFPPIGDLYILKGSILLEENRLAEAEQALTHGLNLVRWTGEYEAHMRGYSTLARVRSIQRDGPGMVESTKFLEETRPEVALYAQALRHRLLIHDWIANKISLDEAHRWVTQAAVRFDRLPDITGVGPVSRIHFLAYLSAAHLLTRLAVRNSKAYSLPDVHTYLARQERFASTHQLVGWLVEIWLVRALLYQVEGRAENAYTLIQAALSASAPRGYFRLFLDEGDLVRPLLESVAPRLKDSDLSAFVKRLLAAMPGESAKGKTKPVDAERFSDRELEVLRLLATGLTYEEIGRQLFLSLNTVQFHVKNIYGKLQVNKRVQAIEKARKLKLI